ncbi:permease [Oceanirhabdus sp. W0125-5]|uniref:permease n=1 Tax=Oceanirhabdus sp. W0125-5 TaxID=2999116 RepID=UPI0022F33B43|nr:permease [Oceanirhabdus sp. W0125-5]WBW96335.1 permease [Oceanirhabdus sp. W0125-5]
MFDWLYKLIELLVVNVFGLSMESKLGSSVHFFFYDTIKILILLGTMIFLISYVRSYFPAERTKKILEKFGGIKGNIMASLLGIVTPFCSCSSVPLFIGFIEAGIPLGVTFSFLITSPIVNEAAFVILLASFGWKVALIYVVTGVIVGVLGGIIIDKLHMEKQVEEYVYQIKMGSKEIETLTKKDRINFAIQNVKDIFKRIWLFLIIGIGIGAAIHGWAPEDILSQYAGPDNPLAVFVAVICGIPLYSNALGTIPIADALIDKGVGIGTALAFMMAVTALSAPEMILLRKVIKPKLIATFVAVTGTAIIIVGYLFNIIL